MAVRVHWTAGGQVFVQGGEGVFPGIDVSFLSFAVDEDPAAAVRDGLDVLDASPHDLDPPQAFDCHEGDECPISEGFEGSVPGHCPEKELGFAGGEVEDLFFRFAISGSPDTSHGIAFDELPVHGRLVEPAHGGQLEGDGGGLGLAGHQELAVGLHVFRGGMSRIDPAVSAPFGPEGYMVKVGIDGVRPGIAVGDVEAEPFAGELLEIGPGVEWDEG